MKFQSFISNAYYYLALALVFMIPVLPHVLPLLMVLWTLTWLLEGDFSGKLQRLKEYKLSWLFISLYLLYLAGLIYSSNIAYGLKDVETKLSLIIAPLVLFTSRYSQRLQTGIVLRTFVAGCFAAAILCFTHAAWLYYDEYAKAASGEIGGQYYNVNFFLASFLSVFLHPSYLSLYLCFSLFLLFRWLLTKQHTVKQNIGIVLGIIVLSVFILLLLSKIAAAILVAIWIGAAVYLVIRRRLYVTGIVVLLTVIALFSAFYFYSENFSGRIDNLVSVMLHPAAVDKTSEESSTVRVLVWKSSAEVISNNPLTGTGTGDAKDALLEVYQREGMTGAYKHQLNSHDQFLQTFVAIGVPGFLALLLSFIIPLSMAIRRRNSIYLVFLLLVFINFITESMLETQAGVIFYAVFNSFLALRMLDERRLPHADKS